jgi:hypothetical protein
MLDINTLRFEVQLNKMDNSQLVLSPLVAEDLLDRIEAAEKERDALRVELEKERKEHSYTQHAAEAKQVDRLRAKIKAIGAAAAPADEPTAPTYSYSTDDEIYHGEFDSPDAAAAEAFYDDPELEAVSVGENRKHTAHFYVSADRILEDVTERAYDECGEASEDWLDGVMHNVDLKAELERLVGDWLQAQEPPNFWRVANTRQITRAEMVAAGKLDTDAA